MTRAPQAAVIIAGRIGTPLQLELGLREWLPDETCDWESAAEVAEEINNVIEDDGVRDEGRRLRWEPAASTA